MNEIAVIIPTITVDHWLDLAVESVLQDDAPGLSIVVVHDGVPPDQNRTWMQDPRVAVLHFENRGGLVAGLLAGIEVSSAPLIARLDADDISEPGRFSRQRQYLADHPDTVLVASEAMRIDEHGAEQGVFIRVAGDDIRPRLLERNVIVHSSVMFRREAYEVAGRFNPLLPQMEDYELWLRMAVLGKIAILSEPLVKYRVHSNQISRLAKPYGAYIRQVRASRYRLARELDTRLASSHWKSLKWSTAQFLRYYGFRKPGYDRT